MRLQRFLLLLGFISASLTSRMASANFIGNDTSNFNPDPAGTDFVSVHSAEPMNPGLISTSFFLNQAENSLPATVDVNGDTIAFHSSIIFADLNFAVGLLKDLDVGATFSFLTNQTVDSTDTGTRFSATGLNEIRFQGRYRLVSAERLSFALVPSLNLNQTKENPFSGSDSGPTLNAEAALTYRLPTAVLGLNLGYRFKERGRPIDQAVYEPLGDEAIASLAAAVPIARWHSNLVAELIAALPTESARYAPAGKLSSEGLLGLRFEPSNMFTIHGGAATRVSKGLFTPDWRVYLGLQLALDFVSRRVTLRQEAPAPVNVTVTETRESTVKYYRGFVPRDIESMREISFDEMAKAREFQLRTQIPATDKIAETEKPPFEVLRLENFDFDFGSAVIKPEYFPLLDRVSEYLNAKPAVLKIQIEGHTDSIGSEERNRKRSQQRADSIRSYVMKHTGLKEAQIVAKGFGSDRPIADNSMSEGRKKNRRVEIRVLRELEPLKETSETHSK